MLNVEIDGKLVEVEHGSTIIDAADKIGVEIPRFCYHKKLSVAANCRMCLVEVEKFRKPLPACATPVADGMKIYTRSKAAVEAQQSVMEFLLINHPFNKPLQIIKAKSLLIRTYFEQFLQDGSYYELVIAQTYAFEKYIRRSKDISKEKSISHSFPPIFINFSPESIPMASLFSIL